MMAIPKHNILSTSNFNGNQFMMSALFRFHTSIIYEVKVRNLCLSWSKSYYPANKKIYVHPCTLHNSTSHFGTVSFLDKQLKGYTLSLFKMNSLKTTLIRLKMMWMYCIFKDALNIDYC